MGSKQPQLPPNGFQTPRGNPHVIVDLLPVGSEVLIGEKIEGVIKSICVNDNNQVTYQVVWWNGNARLCEWLDRFEVEAVDSSSNSTRLGFTFRN